MNSNPNPSKGEDASAASFKSKGDAFYLEHDWHQAVDCYSKAVQLCPEAAIYHIALGGALFNTGLRNEAKAEYREAIRIDPEEAEGHHYLGDALYEEKDLEGALWEWREAARLGYRHVHIYIDMGHVLRKLGKRKQAIEELRKAVRLNPENADAHVHLGYHLRKTGSEQEAIAEWRLALRLNPDNDIAAECLLMAFVRKARRYRTLAHWQAARETAEEALSRRPEWAPALCAAASVAWYQDRDANRAIQILTNAIEADPSCEWSYRLLGYIYSRTGQLRKFWQIAYEIGERIMEAQSHNA